MSDCAIFSFFTFSWGGPLQVRAMECIRQLLLRSAEALFLLQLLCQNHVTRLIQSFDVNLRQELVQLTFHQLVCSEEGDRLATRLISSLMEVMQVQKQPLFSWDVRGVNKWQRVWRLAVICLFGACGKSGLTKSFTEWNIFFFLMSKSKQYIHQKKK